MTLPEFPVLHTPRLTLRAARLEDLPAIKTLFGEYDVAKMTASFPHPLDDEGAKVLLDRFMGNDRKEHIVWAIDDGSGFIGCAGLHNMSTEPSTGYTLGKPYWGKGYGSEAVTAILRFGFEVRNLANVRAGVFDDNPASLRLLEKLGFQKEKPEVYTSRARENAEIPSSSHILHRDAFFKLRDVKETELV